VIVVVMNFSGNVGKSLIAKHLLLPRMPGAEVFAVESINSEDLSEADRLRCKQFGELMAKLQASEDAIIDVGASNVEDFVMRMKQYEASHHAFDMFVIPTVPDLKPMADTLSTIEALAEIGVPEERIQVVMNRLPLDSEALTTFAPIFRACADTKACRVNPAAVIHENELFAVLRSGGQTVAEVAGLDRQQIKIMIRKTEDPAKKAALGRQVASSFLASGVKHELDRVFEAICGN